jgi:hypothetical protein
MVAAASSAGEAACVDHGVVGEYRGRIAALGCGFAERGRDDRAGDAAVGGDREGVAGVVVEPGEDLGVGAIREAPVGGVALPALVGELARRSG